MPLRNPYKEKRRSSLKRDQVLLAIASVGDFALNALSKAIASPIALAQLYGEVGKYGMSADISKINLLEIGDSGAFRDLAESIVYIRKLKRQGLVIEKRKGYITLTERGRRTMLDSLNTPSFARRYEISEKAPQILTMVIFDIPEKENVKRNWLRYQLKSLEFRWIQNSVWLSKHPLPESLLLDIKRYKMLRYIHVFSINRSGTISDLLEKFGFLEVQ